MGLHGVLEIDSVISLTRLLTFFQESKINEKAGKNWKLVFSSFLRMPVQNSGDLEAEVFSFEV